MLEKTYTILAYYILDRVRPIAESILGDYQGGFKPSIFTMNHIFMIRQILQKKWEYNRNVHVLFVD